MNHSKSIQSETELNAKGWDDLLHKHEKNPSELITFVENQPEYSDLVKQAKAGYRIELGEPGVVKKTFSWLSQILLVNPQSLHGKSHVTAQLEKDSVTTAGILTTANMINCGTAFPFLLMTFSNIPLGSIGAVAAMLGLLNFSNACGTAAACNRPGNQKVSQAGMMGLVLLNLALTIFSGPGTELVMNRTELSKARAQEVVKENILMDYTERQKNVESLRTQSATLKSECERKETDIKGMRPGDPNRDRAIIVAHGDHAKRNDDTFWSTQPFETLPTCRQASRLKAEVKLKAPAAKEALDQQKQRINQAGGDLQYLSEMHPDLYAANFDQDGNILSGSMASRLAVMSFGEKISTGQWTSLGFTFFTVCLSIITSGVAVYLTQAHASRKDVKLSFNESLLAARKEFFDTVRRGLTQQDFERSGSIYSSHAFPSPSEISRNGNGKRSIKHK